MFLDFVEANKYILHAFDLCPIFYFIFQEIFVFVWPIRGVNQNKNILQGANQNKKFTGKKTENDLYYRG